MYINKIVIKTIIKDNKIVLRNILHCAKKIYSQIKIDDNYRIRNHCFMR